jgi:hypothetical protein
MSLDHLFTPEAEAARVRGHALDAARDRVVEAAIAWTNKSWARERVQSGESVTLVITVAAYIALRDGKEV